MGDLPARDWSEGSELYHLIAEGIPNMVWTARADGGLDYFNRRVFEYTGLTETELRDWGWRDVIHPDDWAACEARWRHCLETGANYEIEYRIRRGSDSSYRWHLGAALPLRHPDGAVAKWFGTCTDIDDQKRATYARYRSLVEMSPDAMIIRLGDNFEFVNQATLRLLGASSADELLGKSMFDRIHTDDLAFVRQRQMRLDVHDEPLPPAEVRFRRADGRYITLEVMGTPMEFDGRKAALLIWRDLTARKNADQALRKSEQRFEAFMNNTPAVAWIKDSRLRWVYVSPPYEAALGKKTANIVGRDDFEVWPEEIAKRLRRSDLEVLESHAPLTFIHELPDATGNDSYWLSVKFPLVDETGAYGIGGMSIDITKRHRLEQALRDSEAQMSLAMQTAQMAHWSWSPSEGMVYSEGMGSLFGRERGLQIPRAVQWLEVVHPEDREPLLAAARASFASGHLLHHDWRVLKPDGSIAWMSSRAQTQYDESGNPSRMVGITMDITHRRNVQEQLERYSERVKLLLYRLVDAQESERRNIASSLHDLIGQKLTALNIGLDILKKDLHATAGPLVRSRLESMGTIVDETVDAIRGVMQDLRPPELEDFGLVPALHSYARRFEEQTGIRTTVDAAGQYRRLPGNVELALFRVVQEALTNAVKHSGATTIGIRAWQSADCSSLSIEDDGRGFTDPEGARSAWRGGWGLPEMRKRAEAVGGHLQIEFPESGGTRVLVHVASDPC
jgi:PAS domain S-box-containing protein